MTKKWPRLAESEEFTLYDGHVSCNEQCNDCYIDKLYDDAVDTASILYDQYTVCAVLLIYAQFFNGYTGNGTVLADGTIADCPCQHAHTKRRAAFLIAQNIQTIMRI